MINDNYLISFGTYYKYLESSVCEPSIFDRKCEVKIEKFHDGEISVKFLQSLRGQHLFVFGEVTNNLTELILTIDAAKRSSVKEITIILPYFGYSRQDKRESTRGCIGASAFAHVLQGLGINRVISIDLHAAQIQGMFQIPFEHISGRHIFYTWLKKRDLSNAIICSPDAGGINRAAKFASDFNLQMVTFNKHRIRPGEIESMQLIGDVKGKNVYKIDDICDTAGTMIKSDKALLEAGALSVVNLITHPIMSNGAKQKIIDNHCSLVTTNTLNTIVEDSFQGPDYFIQVLSAGPILAETIERIAHEESISTLSI